LARPTSSFSHWRSHWRAVAEVLKKLGFSLALLAAT
jgi:hypothetical protein